jgi:hypothetical protein
MKNIFLLALIIFSGYLCQAQAPIPGKIEAELYDSMSGVQTQQTADSGGGINVGWIDKGDFMSYKVNVAVSGSYLVSFRLACTTPGASFQLLTNGALLTTVNPPVTGDYQIFTTVTVPVLLSAGLQTLTLVSTAAPPWNINWFSFTPGPAGSVTTLPSATRQVDSLAATLDSVIIRNPSSTTATTLSIDTITTSGAQTFLLSVGGFNPSTGDDVSAVRVLRVKSFNGVLSVVRSADPAAWLGTGTLLKTSWTTNTIVGNKLIVKIVTTATQINWTYKRYSL